MSKLRIPTAWSYSAWRQHNECARRYYYNRVERIREPEGPALVKGSRVHKELEEFLLDKRLKEIPEEAESFEDDLKTLRKRKGMKPEADYAIDRDGNEVDWFASDVWLRVKFDAVYWEDKTTLVLIDFKTGNVAREEKPDGSWLKDRTRDTKQIDLYGWFGLRQFEGVELVKAELWYLEAAEVVEHEFEMPQFDTLEETWIARSEAVLTDRDWEPDPSPWKCRWCPHAQSKGGPCDYG